MMVVPMWMSVVSLTAALAWADPPSASEVLGAMEDATTHAIARAEASVVAIARFKDPGAGKETTAVRGQGPVRVGAANPIEANGPGVLLPNAPIVRFPVDDFSDDDQSFDYGSGVVVGPRGEILTAFHVVQGASRIRVHAAGRQAFWAEVIAADPRGDLAVIAPIVERGQPAPTLKPIPLGDATKLRKGSFLVALGNPYNAARDGTASAALGILSNVARQIAPPPPPPNNPSTFVSREFLRNLPTLLQLDSKLNLGMSGGAVVNLKGELVGVTTAAANPVSFDAMAGYAIPMDTLGRRIVQTLMDGREVEYGFLGIKLPEDGSARVAGCELGTPAAEGGLRNEDEIIAVGPTAVTNSDELILAINAMPVGEPVGIKVLRKGRELEYKVLLSKKKVNGEVIVTNRPAPWRGLRVDYTSTLTEGSDNLLNAMSKPGVGVIEVESDSPAQTAGIVRGQIIHKVAGQVVRNPREFAAAVAGQSGPVTLSTNLGTIVVK